MELWAIYEWFMMEWRYSDGSVKPEDMPGIIKESLLNNMFTTILIMLIIFIGIAIIVYIHLTNKKLNIIDAFIHKIKVKILGYDATLDYQEFLAEQQDRLEKMSADYIDNIHWIGEEEITHKFKERPKVIKEFPTIFIWLPMFVITSGWVLFQNLLFFRFGIFTAVKIVFIFVLFALVPQILKVIFPRKLKSCRSWAISENYFIQVRDGITEIELNKKHIFYIDYNGFEIIFDLDGIDGTVEIDSGRDDRLIIEDVDNIEETYAILKEWFNNK